MNLSSNDEGVYCALTSPLITERTLRTVRTQPKRQEQPVDFFSFCYLQSFVIRSSPIASSHQDYADLPKCNKSSDFEIRELNVDFQHHVFLGKTIYEKKWLKKTAGQRGQFVTLERESLIGDKNYFLSFVSTIL